MRRTGVALALVAGLWTIPVTAVELPITATAAIVVDTATGEVLFQRSADLPLPPASTTKILTAIIAIESGHLDDAMEVSAFAASTPPTKVGLPVGSRARLQDLLYAVLLKSANDAAEVVAEGLAGSQEEFADRMNAKARRIGASNSHFENPHGLTADGHVSTARDLARIFRYGLNLPMFRDILSTSAIDFPVEADEPRMVTVRSHNRLLNGYTYPVIGKTGFTRVARRCFVGAATSENREVVIALLGARDLWGDARKLIEFGIEGRTVFDDAPTVMAARDTDEDDEPSPYPYAYDRLARSHHQRALPTPRTPIIAAAVTPRSGRFVRRWMLTKVHGRVIRTLVAQPIAPTKGTTTLASHGGRTAQVFLAKTELRTKDKAAKNTHRSGREVTPLVVFKVPAGKTKIAVGKMALSRQTAVATAKHPTKTSPEPARGKATAAPKNPPTKVRISGQRPSVVARR